MEFSHCLQHHARAWFAAVTVDVVGRLAFFDMMWAIINTINFHAVRGELLFHPAGEKGELVFAVITTGNATLIGDDNQQITLLLQVAASVKNTINKIKLFRYRGVAVVDINDAISVEKAALCNNVIGVPWQ